MLIVYVAGPVVGPNLIHRSLLAEKITGALLDQGVSPDTADVRLIQPGNTATLGSDPEAMVYIYVPTDIASIDKADVVIGLLSSEESGRGTGFELGYAVAKGKRVMPVLLDPAAGRSWAFAISNVPFSYMDLDEVAHAIAFMARQVLGVRANTIGREQAT